MNSRFKLVLDKLKDNKLDGLLVNHQANVSYLSKFKSDASYLLISPKETFYITDFRYTQEVKNKVSGIKVFQYKNLFKDTASLVNKLKIKRLGFESKSLNYAEFTRLKEYLPPKIRLIDTFNIIEDLRQFKDKEELVSIKKAIDITIQTFDFLKKNIKPGQTELQIAGKIHQYIRFKGSIGAAFDFLIASGPNSSYPHAGISNRKITAFEPVLIDIGVEVDGYKSDLTRVFFLDRIKPIHRKVYNLVKEAQIKAIAAIKPGVQIDKIDYACRNYLKIHGLSKYFGHSTGHGLGLEIHEEPSISSKNKSLTREGMVFTIEPGVYLPNNFGIRLEDMVYVTKKGVDILSGALNKSI